LDRIKHNKEQSPIHHREFLAKISVFIYLRVADFIFNVFNFGGFGGMWSISTHS